MQKLFGAIIIVVISSLTHNAYASQSWQFANSSADTQTNSQGTQATTAQISTSKKATILGIEAPADPVWEGNKGPSMDDSSAGASSSESSDDYNPYLSE